MAIRDWPKSERPRERLIKHGAHVLSDAELLAIFLRVGVSGLSAVDLARKMLKHFGSLSALFSANLEDFSKIKGLGAAKYAQLQAAFELSGRALAEGLQTGEVLNSPEKVRSYLRLLLSNKDREVFWVLFLDVKNRLLATEELFKGTLTQANVYARDVVKSALTRNAASVIFAHNHPSGNTEPSRADKELTRNLKEALSLIEVRVLDHFIVSSNDIFSFAEAGLI